MARIVAGASSIRSVICPTGNSANFLSRLSAKKKSLCLSGKSSLQIRAIPSRQEGRFAIVTNAGWDAVDVTASKDERCWFADGEVVWS